MNELGKRLRKYRNAAGLTQDQVAEQLGFNGNTTIGNYETGRREPSLKVLEELAQIYNVKVERLVFGIGEMEGLHMLGSIRGQVPLISWVQAGQWSEIMDVLQPGEYEALMPCPVAHSQQTYALRVEGDSMTGIARAYPHGAIIYCDPEKRGNAKPGDCVIAKVKGDKNTVTFKQLAMDGTRPYLRALNPQHPPIWDEFEILAVVIGQFQS